MGDGEMLTQIDGSQLAEAFPAEHRRLALAAGRDAARRLAPRQWTERFAVQVDGQAVLIPARLHFAYTRLALTDSDEGWLLARALQTRSNDGFERQRAARDLVKGSQPWAAPFIAALIGEYIVEILEDILAAMTPELEQTLGQFIACNLGFWSTTQRRVTSYWNAYYRSGWGTECRRPYPRNAYVGFALVDRLQAAAFRFTKAPGQ